MIHPGSVMQQKGGMFAPQPTWGGGTSPREDSQVQEDPELRNLAATIRREAGSSDCRPEQFRIEPEPGESSGAEEARRATEGRIREAIARDLRENPVWDPTARYGSEAAWRAVRERHRVEVQLYRGWKQVSVNARLCRDQFDDFANFVGLLSRESADRRFQRARLDGKAQAR